MAWPSISTSQAHRSRRAVVAFVCAVGLLFADLLGCGARSDLDTLEDVPCHDGTVEACGSELGECRPGQRTCTGGAFGPCEGAVGPFEEACNDRDDDCDGEIDEPWLVGQACDGPDADSCPDDIGSCAGCSDGDDNVETCNGLDDDCNGIIDADCHVGDCRPTLLVTGSVPSSPDCVDFPVEAGSTGIIVFPCGGGEVSAELGSVIVSGTVVDGFVSLDGTAIVGPGETPDGCFWQTSHHIEGVLASGTLTYEYAETLIDGVGCWSPCTETGTIVIQWDRGSGGA